MTKPGSNSRRRALRPEAVSVQQAAGLLGVHHRTVRRWITGGFIRAYRVGPQLIRIPRSEISRMRGVRLPKVIEGDRYPYPRV